MKRLLAFCCALLLAAGLPGCGKPDPEQASVSAVSVSVVEVADPEQALTEIYAEIDPLGLSEATDEILSDKFLIEPDMLTDYWVRYSNGRFGVSDVFLLQPREDDVLTVREALEKVKLSRAKEFENYDIYNAHQIALDAQIFEQGDFVVMLMLEDNDAARTIIDKYIPKK